MARTELITNITKLFSQLSRQDIEVSVKVILDSIATRWQNASVLRFVDSVVSQCKRGHLARGVIQK